MLLREFLNPIKEDKLYDVRWRKTIVQGDTVWEVLLSDGTVEIRPWNFGQDRPPDLNPMPGFPEGNPNWEYNPKVAKQEPKKQVPSVDVSGTSTPNPPFSVRAIDQAMKAQSRNTAQPDTNKKIQDLAKANNISNPSLIKAGQIINIPGEGKYQIAPGDNLWNIVRGKRKGKMLEGGYPFAGKSVGHKEGPAGQWRNKGPKKDKPAKVGDLVGGGAAEESVELDERKRKRRKRAAYGPGPYGWYGYYSGYSGDGGEGGGGDAGGIEEGDLIPWPKGTVKVDVDDVYDWYKLGQNISDLDDADPKEFGKGPPQTILSFGSEPLEHKYLKNLKRLGMPTHDIDETVKVTMKQSLYENIVATDFMSALKDFLPIAMRVLKISKLPHIKLMKDVGDEDQPTFGRFKNDELIIDIGLNNRHPNDILRTLAHELVHFKQMMDNRLNPHSGDTGSPEENEAHAVAGVIMRHFNKIHPQYLRGQPLDLQETATAGATSAGNVSTGPFVKNKRARKQPVGANALDGNNLLAIGGVVKR
jgi:hypothetical protein